MKPSKIYYEENILEYPLGKYLYDKYKDVSWTPIDNHNNIEELRSNENKEFINMKRYVIIGTRKTHKYVENNKTSDYLVPYTSSGCSAMCLYCYLVCNYNKCSYLRLFVNREKMMEKLIKTSNKSDKDLIFEVGSNSDLVLEDTFTNNLAWTIEQFGSNEKGFITFPTKFSMVDSILPLEHKGRTIIRMSMNPQEIINQIEIGTSSLENRITAINKLSNAGYKIGLLIAPIILIDNWKEYYTNLINTLADSLLQKVIEDVRVEIIFMTYSFVHRAINAEAFPNDVELYNKDAMTGRGRGKYCYKPDIKEEAKEFIRELVGKVFKIEYIV